ncbi:MAG: peptidoglycan binding protein CsiV [Gammaproteobacteria bacterium]|nr:peptidoglycan binding protein CsiV [Gammaproteobacteria bacterium]
MKGATAILTALLLAGSAAGTRAQNVQAEVLPVYDIELVVFRYLRPLISSEQWTSQTIAANLGGALDFSQPETLLNLEEVVTPSEPQRLLEHAAKLGKLSNFKVLLHRAWRQPGFENDAALAIRLNAGRLDEPLVEQKSASWNVPFSASPSEPHADGGVQIPRTASSPQPVAQQQSIAPQPADAGQRPAAAVATDGNLAAVTKFITHTLDGTLTLVRSRFLHVYTDLIYTIPSDTLAHAIRQRPLGHPVQATIEVGSGAFGLVPEALSMQSFPLRYHRRMRSKELHYIDHPLLGILILVTPVEADASELTQ